jgi:uncharacterized protein (DUF1697 family)
VPALADAQRSVFSRERNAAKLEFALERAIEERFGFHVRVVVRSRSEVEGVVARIPEPWMGTEALRVTVAFLLRGNDARAIAGSRFPRDGIDQVVAAPGALIWAIRRDALTRTGIRLIGTPIYKEMTLRKLNTTLKLAELVRNA